MRTAHTTIRDYWNWQNRPGMRAVKRHAHNNSTFSRLVQSAGIRGHRANGRGEQGLTIQDYRRRAVPAGPPFNLSDKRPQTRAVSTAPTGPPVDDVQNTSPTDRGAGSHGAAPTNAAEHKNGNRQAIDQAIAAAAKRYGLSADLIRSVIRHESNFNPRAVSPAGAQGLMQLMPDTARELGVHDAFAIAPNIDGGSRYLKRMLDRFDGDLRKALAAYNAGPGTVRRYNGVPPYPETRNYVRKVMASVGESA